MPPVFRLDPVFLVFQVFPVRRALLSPRLRPAFLLNPVDLAFLSAPIPSSAWQEYF
ncbi:hypothetical protein [Paenibacillus sp. BT-177]|uniref:hypothetical protein n=1 Tax=Paenibacillus sp. BT-177 TaxID=2986930 RepID=UPI0021F70E8D|nr:hypothetical protein [Paenibacillus sp. BT-177]